MPATTRADAWDSDRERILTRLHVSAEIQRATEGSPDVT